MKLWKAYMKEREGAEIFDSTDGFVVYFITGKECYVKDIYVVPEKRHKGEARKMLDAIVKRAQNMGCTFISGNVDLNVEGAADALKFQLAYGGKPISATANVVTLVKEFEGNDGKSI